MQLSSTAANCLQLRPRDQLLGIVKDHVSCLTSHCVEGGHQMRCDLEREYAGVNDAQAFSPVHAGDTNQLQLKYLESTV